MKRGHNPHPVAPGKASRLNWDPEDETDRLEVFRQLKVIDYQLVKSNRCGLWRISDGKMLMHGYSLRNLRNAQPSWPFPTHVQHIPKGLRGEPNLYDFRERGEL